MPNYTIGTIQVHRGTEAQILASTTALEGEPAYSLDTNKWFCGHNGTFHLVVSAGQLTAAAIIAALTYTPENAATSHVNTFNGRSGAVVLTSADVNAVVTIPALTQAAVIAALTYTPLSNTDPAVTNSRTPTGAAGGDLAGTYPNPTLGVVAGLTPGTTGDATHVAQVTVDSKGRVTGAAPITITFPPPPVTSVFGRTGTVVLTASDVNTALTYTPENTAGRGAANGYASLDSGGKVVSSQLPALAITDTFVVASQVAMLALTAQVGDVTIRTDLSESFILQGSDPTQLSSWQQLLSPTAPVTSFNGRTGVLTLTSGDVTGALTFTPPPATRTLTAGTGLTGGGDLSADRSFAVNYGTAAGTSAQGNDGRLSDARTPAGAAGGDLTGAYPNPTLASILTAGTVGDTTHIPVITYDSKGRITAVSTAAASGGGGATAPLTLTSTAPTMVPLTLVGNAGQTALLLRETDSVGNLTGTSQPVANVIHVASQAQANAIVWKKGLNYVVTDTTTEAILIILPSVTGAVNPNQVVRVFHRRGSFSLNVLGANASAPPKLTGTPIEDTHYTTYVPAYAFDGALSPPWIGGTWIGLDLGAGNNVSVDTIRYYVDNVYNEYNTAVFQGSMDGTTWTSIYTIPATATQFIWYTRTFAPTAAYRYYRLNSIGQCPEFEIYPHPLTDPIDYLTTNFPLLPGEAVDFAPDGSLGWHSLVGVPIGASGQTLRYNASGVPIANSVLTNDGATVAVNGLASINKPSGAATGLKVYDSVSNLVGTEQPIAKVFHIANQAQADAIAWGAGDNYVYVDTTAATIQLTLPVLLASLANMQVVVYQTAGSNPITVVGTPAGGGPPSLVNPSFESPVVANQYVPSDTTNPTGWVRTSGYICNGGNAYGGSAHTGSQYFMGQINFNISQTITFPTSGNFQLQMWINSRAGVNGNSVLTVKIDGTTVATIDPTLFNYTTYHQVAANLGTVSAGSHTITINYTQTDSADVTLFLDDITMTSTASYIMNNLTTYTYTGPVQVVPDGVITWRTFRFAGI